MIKRPTEKKDDYLHLQYLKDLMDYLDILKEQVDLIQLESNWTDQERQRIHELNKH
jgi:hypothetical protein